MDFELSNTIEPLVNENRLQEAIEICEAKLQDLDETKFHAILGKNLLHMTDKSIKWLDNFFNSVSEEIGPNAIYCELNGFTINYDQWYADGFIYKKYGGLEDMDWLAYWDKNTSTELVITRFQDLQEAFEDFDTYGAMDENHQKSSDLCEQLVILRFQELIQSAFLKAKKDNLDWGRIPVLSNAHDYNLIHQSN